MPSQWNLQQDMMMLKQDPTLQVGRCTKILNPNTAEAKYIVAFKHHGKFVVGLDKDLAPTDVEEGMRVGCERPGVIGSKLSIKLPLAATPTATQHNPNNNTEEEYSKETLFADFLQL